MLGQLDMSLILSSLFLSLIRHVHRQIHYQNQITNVQRAYHILTYKNWFMLWQTSIMYSGKHDFLDWIISATIHLENPANKGPLFGNINYPVSCSMSNPIMPPTDLINLYLACIAVISKIIYISYQNMLFLQNIMLYFTIYQIIIENGRI